MMVPEPHPYDPDDPTYYDETTEDLGYLVPDRGLRPDPSEGDDRKRHAREQLNRLTEREREVAVAIGQGKSNAEISRELYMSVATAKAHVSRVLEKLEFNHRVQIALLAHDAGQA